MKTLTTLVLVGCLAATANAHFIWLAPGQSDGSATVNVYFGEDATDDNADYLSRVQAVSVFRIVGTDAAAAVELTKTRESISATTTPGEQCVYVTSHDLGVMDRGDSKFRLKSCAKTGPDASSTAWQAAICTDDLKLDVVPSVNAGKVTVQVCFAEKPMAGVQIKAAGPGVADVELETDKAGQATFAVADAGLYSIRARYVDAVAGEVDGKAYPETRHYSPVAVTIPATNTATNPSAASSSFPNVPQPVTSFGAAVLADSLYMYGGHTGGAHSYSQAEQSNTLTRLDLKTGQWETMIEGPHLQGLALVAHGDKLYRVGGFTAMNAEGEDHDLQSQNLVACYQPSTKAWQELPALPERRSSHDAAVVGDCIYVVGGWAMGDGESHWHDTAWKLDLTQQPRHWQPIASPPFRRRALAAAAFDGKLYAVGGMQDEGGPTTDVAVYNPATDAWSEGPSLYVKPEEEPAAGDSEQKPRGGMSSGKMAGFGASAFATGGALYVTTVQGNLQKLSDDGKTWNVITDDITPRFFHRLLPMSDTKLVVVGGSNMSIGKFEEVEVLGVDQGS